MAEIVKGRVSVPLRAGREACVGQIRAVRTGKCSCELDALDERIELQCDGSHPALPADIFVEDVLISSELSRTGVRSAHLPSRRL